MAKVAQLPHSEETEAEVEETPRHSSSVANTTMQSIVKLLVSDFGSGNLTVIQKALIDLADL